MVNIITFKERNPNIRSSLKINPNIDSRTVCLRGISDCLEKYWLRACTGALRMLPQAELIYFLNKVKRL